MGTQSDVRYHERYSSIVTLPISAHSPWSALTTSIGPIFPGRPVSVSPQILNSSPKLLQSAH
jgi:hypothetical protein